jgi:ABC-2 type transport system permease protein
LAGYTSNQAIFFFLVFNLLDTVTQFFFREVYRFRPMVIKGDFDYVLAKPMSPLFRVLLGGADVIDFVTILPQIIAVIYLGSLLHPSVINTLYFVLLFINSLIIATAFHIIVLSLGIITLEIDHTVMIYRDLTSLGRFPVDIYKQPLQGILTYVIPVGIMMTFPSKALMGIINLQSIVLICLFGLVFMFISLKFWNFALTKYTSASS